MNFFFFFLYKKVLDLLIAVEGVNVLHWDGHQVRRDVPIDKGKGLPRLQITVGHRPIFIVAVAAAPCPWSPGLLLGDAPLNGGQRLGDEGAEAVRSRRNKQLCHLVILLFQRSARGSAGIRSCNTCEKYEESVSLLERVQSFIWGLNNTFDTVGPNHTCRVWRKCRCYFKANRVAILPPNKCYLDIKPRVSGAGCQGCWKITWPRQHPGERHKTSICDLCDSVVWMLFHAFSCFFVHPEYAHHSLEDNTLTRRLMCNILA